MKKNKSGRLRTHRKKIEELERAIEKERRALLADLHIELGFDSREALISALRDSPGSAGVARAPKKKRARKAAGKKSVKRGARKRAVISQEKRDQIKEALLGGKGGAATAREFGVSVPTIQNIKKELGLISGAKKSARKATKKAGKKAAKKARSKKVKRARKGAKKQAATKASA